MTNDELAGAQVAFGLVSRLLYFEPSDEEVSSYLQLGLFDTAPFAAEDLMVVEGLTALRRWCDQTRELVESGGATLHDRAADLRRDWLNLLVGTGEPKAPSWAGYYLNPSSTLLGESALAVRKLYKLHGYELERRNQEPDDNLGIMLGFIAVLIQLELDNGEVSSSSEIAFDAACDGASATCQEQLLRKYILPWLPLWRWSVERFARTAFYRGLGDLTFGLVRTYATRFGFEYCADAENPHFVQRG